VNVVERYLEAIAVTHDWNALADCLADDDFHRIGPFGDIYDSKASYLAFITDLMPRLPGYHMDVERVTFAGEVAFAELSETVEVDGRPRRTPESLVFDLAADGRIRRVSVYLQTGAEQ
jgi:SnoaL-like protein